MTTETKNFCKHKIHLSSFCEVCSDQSRPFRCVHGLSSHCGKCAVDKSEADIHRRINEVIGVMVAEDCKLEIEINLLRHQIAGLIQRMDKIESWAAKQSDLISNTKCRYPLGSH